MNAKDMASTDYAIQVMKFSRENKELQDKVNQLNTQISEQQQQQNSEVILFGHNY